MLDYVVTGKTVSRQAAVALVPVCVGVGIVSWVDANRDASGGGNGSGGEGGSDGGTALLGIVFAITGVGASAVYTVLIAKSHKTTGLSSMQLLLNQAPVSVLLLLYVVPFVDDIAIWRYGIEGSAWVLIGLVSLSRTLLFSYLGGSWGREIIANSQTVWHLCLRDQCLAILHHQ